MKRYPAAIALAVATILVLGACGGGEDSGAEGSVPDSDVTATTVAVSDVEGVGEVLVDADGAALYAADEEADGTVVCLDACTAVWEPLTVSGDPTGGDGLGPSLGVVTRPDGAQQVTFEGRPLYRFVEDESGTVSGNGSSDSFEDQAFTWHVATPTGISTSNANSGSTGSPYEGGYGG